MSGAYRAIADYYDAEYSSNDLLDNDVPFLLAQMPRRRQNVLELCTGTARVAIPLAQAGHRVTGVDIDRDLLAIATRKRDAVGITPRQLDLVRGDVLKLDLPPRLDRPQRFDWCVLLFNTLLNFTTLQQQDALLERVCRHLKPGGRFWVDIFNPDLSILAREHAVDLDVALFHVPALDRSVTRTTEIRRLPRPQLQEVTFHYAWLDDHGTEYREQTCFEATWMTPRELTLLLERHGLAVESMWGDYDGQAVDVESPRIIVQARLKK